MNFDLPNWLSGLGQSGWIAILMLIAFVIITTVIIVMIWKLLRETSPVATRTKEPDTKQRSPATPASKQPVENVDAVAEAEVYITYGLHKQAVNVLEKHLLDNPSDKRASEMLERARKQS